MSEQHDILGRMGKRARRRNRDTARQHALPTALVDDESAGSTGRSDQPTGRLTELVRQRRQLEAAIDDEIGQLVDANIGWPAIAAALGITRQAARQRHHRRAGRPQVHRCGDC